MTRKTGQPELPMDPIAASGAPAAVPPTRPSRRVTSLAARLRANPLVVVLLAIGLGGCVLLGLLYLRLSRQQGTTSQQTALWSRYHQSLQRGSLEEIAAALEDILAQEPHHPHALLLLQALSQQRSTPETAELAIPLLHAHLQADRLSQAAAEADAVLERQPKYWLAHCARLHHAIHRGRPPDELRKLIAAFPDPSDETAHTTPGGLLYAIHLWNAAGADTTPLVRTIHQQVIPLMRTPTAAAAPPLVQLQLVECYCIAWADASHRHALPGYWAAADQLAERAVATAIAHQDTAPLRYWLTLVPRLHQVLNYLPPSLSQAISQQEQPQQLLREALHRRSRAVLLTLHKLNPRDVGPYLGLAELALQQGDVAAAGQHLLEGLQQVGEHLSLWEQVLAFVARYGTADSLALACDGIWTAARQDPQSADKWLLAAHAALLVHRADRAIEACQRVRQLQPQHVSACVLEAWLWLRSGEPAQAHTLLTGLPPELLCRSPVALHLWGRSLAEAEHLAVVEQQLQSLQALHEADPSASFAYLSGVIDAPPDATRLGWVVTQLRRLPPHVQRSPTWLRLHALALYRRAESLMEPPSRGTSAVWNDAAVMETLQALDRIASPELQRDPELLLTQATLHACARGYRAAALRLVQPYRDNAASLTPDQQIRLAWVLLACGQPQEAARILEPLQHQPLPPVMLHLGLARAYHELRRPMDARHCFAQASSQPRRTPREHAEWVACKRLLTQETPP